MTPISFGGDGDDKARLISFVHGLHDLLELLATDDRAQTFFYPDLYGYMREAWGETARYFEPLVEKIRETNSTQLAEHGLMGVHLRFKLAVINFFSERFFGVWQPLRTTRNTIESRTVRKWLNRLLNAINKLLTSLLDAVGGKGLISEYKDFLESCIE